MSREGLVDATSNRINPLGLGPPFENGHVTHLDLAAVHPRGPAGFKGGPHPHGHPPHHDIGIGSGGFLSSSLSAAALNASSCAVPMMDMGVAGGGGPSPRAPHLAQSSLGWSSNGSNTISGRGTGGGGVRYQHQHQEECPHYNSYKEAPT